jgi:hypothetical protein
MFLADPRNHEATAWRGEVEASRELTTLKDERAEIGRALEDTAPMSDARGE